MSNEKSFSLFATLHTPVGANPDYQPFVVHRDGATYTIWVRAELNDCNYIDAMDIASAHLRDGENLLNTRPA